MWRLATILAFTALAPSPADPPLPNELRLNDIQVVGTHNSYHKAPPTGLYTVFSDRARAWEYTHAPIAEQLATQGIRALEFDLYNDPEGGVFAHTLLGHAASNALARPGIKVLHIPQFDQGTRCTAFADALSALKAFSAANPAHVPILVQLELKEASVAGPAGFTIEAPPPFDAKALDALDAQITEALGADRLLAPDLVRGESATLREAVTTRGWPTLQQSAGRVLFVLQASGGTLDRYLAGHPSCRNRVCFVDVPAEHDAAAYRVVNDPIKHAQEITRLVQQGFIVRTRADANLEEVRANDTVRRDAAFASGAQVVSTDAPTSAAHLKSRYACQLPDGGCWRRNPITKPARAPATPATPPTPKAAP